MSIKKSYEEFAKRIFSSEGLLAASLDGFEERTSQWEMSFQIFESYLDEKIALIEAGTGTGKSFAYLVPALFWAVTQKEKTVISTHTIALQEQLFHKDLPLLLQILGIDIKVVLVKGMGNYLCMKKFHEQESLSTTLFSEGSPEWKVIENWGYSTKDGSKSNLSFPVSSSNWDKVSADSDSCTHIHCPEYKNCHFFAARKNVADAQILIVNHYLLFADMVAKNRKDYNEEKSILPPFTRMIIDEAHHIEQIALDSLAIKIHRSDLYRLLNRIISEGALEQSPLGKIREKLLVQSKNSKDLLSILQRVELDIPAEKRIIMPKIAETFTLLDQFFEESKREDFREKKWRLRKSTLQDSLWKDNVVPAFQELVKELKKFSQMLLHWEEDLYSAVSDVTKEKIRSSCMEMHTLFTRLEELVTNLQNFFEENDSKNRVRYIEKNILALSTNTTLIDATLDISSYLSETLFKKQLTVGLCSATLTTMRDFGFIKKNLGIDHSGREVTEKVYDSPFDYEKNSLFLVPSDIADPSSPAFASEAYERIWNLIQVSEGNAFILFTSYEMLISCYEKLAAKAEKFSYSFLRQGEASRQVLLEKFRSRSGSVLFGTDSFWEGIDIPGDILRLIVIVKLPFKVPSEPMVEAYYESLVEQGRDPFLEYSVPQAVVKFKQGFGRLIRKKTDRGCVVCLDKRVMTKAYGKFFLKSLPPSRVVFQDTAKVLQEMRVFYITTHPVKYV